MAKFTVISLDDGCTSTIVDHVTAENHDAAMAWIGLARPSVEVVACIRGHLKDGEDISCAGDGPVLAGGIIEWADGNTSQTNVIAAFIGERGYTIKQEDGMFAWVGPNGEESPLFDTMGEALDNCVTFNFLEYAGNPDGSYGRMLEAK